MSRTIDPEVTVCPDGFDYSTAGGKITSTSAPRPERFTWGKVIRVHVVGEDYAIVEYVPRRPSNVSVEDYDSSPQFGVFVRGARRYGWDTGRSWRSLDEALIAAIAWRVELAVRGVNVAANSRVVGHIVRMLELDHLPKGAKR